MPKILLVRDDGSKEDITQQVTDIELFEGAFDDLSDETLKELAQLMAFNRAAYRSGLLPAISASASELMDDIVGSEKGK